MSVLSLPVVFSQSASPCLEPCCSFLRARFLQGRAGVSKAAAPLLGRLSRSPPGAANRPRGAPAVVLEALLEAPPLLLRGLAAAQAGVLGEESGSGSQGTPPPRPWDTEPAWRGLQAGVPSTTARGAACSHPEPHRRLAFRGCHALARPGCFVREGRTRLPVSNSAPQDRTGQRPLQPPPGIQVEQSPSLGSVTRKPVSGAS